MSEEEATTPDLVELTREIWAASNRRDWDAVLSFYAPDSVFEGRVTGDRCEGLSALRSFFADFVATFEGFETESHETLDLGNGVLFVIVIQRGRPAGSTREVRMRNARVSSSRRGWSPGTRPTAPTSTRPVLPPNASPRSGPVAEERATPDLLRGGYCRCHCLWSRRHALHDADLRDAA